MTIKLTRLEAENFKKLTSVDITFGDRLTEISGHNGAGKSSTLDALYVSLRGLADKSVSLDEPIRIGADACFIRSHLQDDKDGLVITRRFKRKDDKITSDLIIETPEGARFPSPQKHLDKIISDHMLDPIAFLSMSDAEQFDVLRQFVPGIDFTVIDNANKGDYAKRTDVNREQKEAQAKADAIVVSSTEPEKVDESELVKQLTESGQLNTDIELRRTNRANTVKRVDELRKSVIQHDSQIDQRKTDVNERLASDKADIQKQIAALQERLASLDDRATQEISAYSAEQQALADQATKSADELQWKLDSAEPLPALIDVAALAERLNAARTANVAHAAWERNSKAKADAQTLADSKLEQSDRLTAAMAERTQQKQAAIAKANLPVKGIEFGDGMLLLNGVPFRQASTAEKYRTALAIVVAKNPRLRVAWIRDASLLDDNSLRIIEQLAEEYDCQVLLETVRPMSGNAIVLEDGHLKAADSVAQDDAA